MEQVASGRPGPLTLAIDIGGTRLKAGSSPAGYVAGPAATHAVRPRRMP